MMTAWDTVAGLQCEVCAGPATHYYGTMLICCGCHVGEPDGGIFTAAQAQEEHDKVLQQRQEGQKRAEA